MNDTPHSQNLLHNSSTSIRLLNYRDAAAALCISERSLWSLVKAGRLPCVKIGAAVRIDPRDIERFIAAAKLPTPAEVSL